MKLDPWFTLGSGGCELQNGGWRDTAACRDAAGETELCNMSKCGKMLSGTQFHWKRKAQRIDMGWSHKSFHKRFQQSQVARKSGHQKRSRTNLARPTGQKSCQLRRKQCGGKTEGAAGSGKLCRQRNHVGPQTCDTQSAEIAAYILSTSRMLPPVLAALEVARHAMRSSMVLTPTARTGQSRSGCRLNETGIRRPDHGGAIA